MKGTLAFDKVLAKSNSLHDWDDSLFRLKIKGLKFIFFCRLIASDKYMGPASGSEDSLRGCFGSDSVLLFFSSTFTLSFRFLAPVVVCGWSTFRMLKSQPL